MIMDVGTRHTLVLLFDHWSVLVGKSNSAQPGFSHQASVCMILYDNDYVRGSNKIPHRKMGKHIVDSLTLQMQKSANKPLLCYQNTWLTVISKREIHASTETWAI